MSTRVRRAVLWVPDWPVVAAMGEAGVSADAAAGIMHGRGLVAVSAQARAQGVKRGMRKRQAQRLCPEIALLPYDEGRDARAFEAVAAAAEEVVSGLEVSRPGLLMIPADGAARFHGGESELAEKLVTAVVEIAHCESSVGMADGLLAAILAARSSAMVPAGASAEFLAGQPASTLVFAAMERKQRPAMEDLVSVLARLGLHTLGDFTALPIGDVLARFGAPGMWAYRLAQGEDIRPPVLRRSEDDIEVRREFEDAAHRVEQLAFVARRAAEDLDTLLLSAGARCSRVNIAVTTERGELLERTWRTDVGVREGAFARHMSDRVRWQLEGWLSGTAGGPDPSPLTSLTLTARDVIAIGDEQAYLWGGVSGADARAHRTMERIQGLVGPESVLTAQEQGGRAPGDRITLVPWGQEPGQQRKVDRPWPGQLPEPAPATVLTAPEPVRVLDAGGRDVVLSERLGLSAPPTWVRRPGGDVPIEAWAGPWPVVERWWSEDAARRAYVQVALTDGSAALIATSKGEWSLEALYD